MLAVLAGCTVGPDYHGPVAVRSGIPARFARADASATAPHPPASRWWQALGDPVLTALIDKGLANSPDVASAAARLRQARAALRVERTKELPSAKATAVYAYARAPGAGLGGGTGSSSTLDIYDVGFDASWEVDLFGGQRRAIEAARATAGGAEADLADTQVSLSAEIAEAYVNLRDRQDRIALNRRSVAMQEQMIALTRQRFAGGTASRLDLARLQTDLDNSRADLTPLSAQLDAYRDALAVLTGEAPGALDTQLAAPVPVPLPPAKVAIGDPGSLIQRRPDLRSAERTLAADTAKIGQAEAARFPSVSFMGIVGIGGTKAADLTNLDDFTALLAPQLSWSFLDFGANRARIRQAEAVRDEADAKYRSAVLSALQDAEDSLSRFGYQRAAVAMRARALASADEAQKLSALRYKAGTTTLIDVLDTERQRLSAQNNLSEAKAMLTNDFISIQKALGLGWGRRPPSPPAIPRSSRRAERLDHHGDPWPPPMHMVTSP